MIPPLVRPATSGDVAAITRLLEASSLSPDGLVEFLDHFLVALDGEDIVGTVGLEPYGSAGLLRSLAVAPSQRSRGIGLVLLQQAVSEARRRGLTRLILLTTTASDYFTRHGWHRIDRASVTGAITTSSQFTGACPSTATCMEMGLSCGF